MGDQGVQQMQQQPVVVYPNAYPKQYPPYPSSSSASSSSSSSGSRGSFGTVFIVLAVILVLSVLACVFGRLCNREGHASKQPKHEKGSSKKSREIRPVDREPRERGDLEFGLDLKRPEPIEKPSGRDHGEDIEFGFDNKREERGGGGPPPPPVIKHGVRFKLPENGDQHAEGEIRRGGPEIEFRSRQ
ncbi:unnamed protein product [Eruca vesicaria subsp. sativa]|uniref:Transmembrane protein n=1 Tax=Eruca vesicaria subsp. sativa TaxID=29727 RepID=A0ABC8K5B2_ERUVS|nr:unnamed protein product [Eruca vesicaria subsp. sativa]